MRDSEDLLLRARREKNEFSEPCETLEAGREDQSGSAFLGILYAELRLIRSTYCGRSILTLRKVLLGPARVLQKGEALPGCVPRLDFRRDETPTFSFKGDVGSPQGAGPAGMGKP